MDEGTLPPTGQLSPAWVDFFIVLGVILAVSLALVIWALIFSTKARRRRHRHRHHHHHHHQENYREKIRKNAAGLKELIQPHHHHHHHRHEHRPTNPTLAETGGLPPLRGQEKPPLPPP
jgi:ABC-type transport system involved in cytochrome bd biosynthesis fused ATPase/permease subunit